MKNILFILFVSCILTSCSVTSGKNSSAAYPDIPAYFEEEMEYLERVFSVEVPKTVVVGDSTERKMVIIKDWKTEMQDFFKIDLNNPSIQDYIRADTVMTFDEKNSYQIVYEITSPKSELQKVSLAIKDNKILTVQAWYESSTLVMEDKKHLRYMREAGYLIRGYQKAELKAPINYSIEVETDQMNFRPRN